MARKDDLLGVSGAETVIGAGVKLKGDLHSDSDIVVDGILTGDIKSGGNVTVGVNAQIKADITGENVSVSGSVQGDVRASGATSITETGKVQGNITTTTLSVAPGAIFLGSISMAQTEPSVMADDEQQQIS